MPNKLKKYYLVCKNNPEHNGEFVYRVLAEDQEKYLRNKGIKNIKIIGKYE
jgi:hypothetical protein